MEVQVGEEILLTSPKPFGEAEARSPVICLPSWHFPALPPCGLSLWTSDKGNEPCS